MPQTDVTYVDFGGQEEALIFKWLGVVRLVGGLVCCCFLVDSFYIALFSAIEQIHCACM